MYTLGQALAIAALAGLTGFCLGAAEAARWMRNRFAFIDHEDLDELVEELEGGDDKFVDLAARHGLVLDSEGTALEGRGDVWS